MYISICAQHAKSIERRKVYARSVFEKRERKVFFVPFYIIFSWNIHENHVPCSMECAVFPEVVCTFSVVSCVVQWKANIFFFPPLKNCFFVRTIHIFRAVLVQFLHQRAFCSEKTKKNTLSERQKVFQLSTLFEITFLCFSFSLHSLSVVCEHFIDLEQPNDICCSSRHHSFPYSSHTFSVVVKTTTSMM